MTIRRALARQHGLRMSDAADGDEALKLVAQHLFAFVISDLRKPKMAGMQLLQHLKQVPVIAITAGRSDRPRCESVAGRRGG